MAKIRRQHMSIEWHNIIESDDNLPAGFSHAERKGDIGREGRTYDAFGRYGRVTCPQFDEHNIAQSRYNLFSGYRAFGYYVDVCRE